MERRDFMTLCAAAGLSLFGRDRAARAKEAGGDSPLFVCIHASGGWDTSALCDPKGSDGGEGINRFAEGDIGRSGALRWAPIPGAEEFFEKHHSRILVVNGIDTATNGHDSGVRHVWSGRLVEGYPAFAAVAAAPYAGLPMAFVTNGGYDYTGGLVAPTRVGNPSVLLSLAYPHRTDLNDPSQTFHSGRTSAAIDAFRRRRLDQAAQPGSLPAVAASAKALQDAHARTEDLHLLSQVLPQELDKSDNPLIRQAQLAVGAFQVGLAVSANLVIGGFDTHGAHDQLHHPRLKLLMEGVDALWTMAKENGIEHRLTIIVGSDFGRTPWYNAGMGKDHWSITSMMMMGRGITGDRVVGATDERLGPIAVNPGTLELDPAGVRLTPQHIHSALRELAQVGTLGGRFALSERLDGLLSGSA